MTGNLSSIILRHYATEKSTQLAGNACPQYTFKVKKIFTKNQIKKAVEQKFNVKVFAVNIINMLGKIRRFGGVAGKKNDWKKVYIILQKGYSINLEVKSESTNEPAHESKFKTGKS